ncbi:MAG: ATP-binding protein [Actinomycetota bacterium]
MSPGPVISLIDQTLNRVVVAFRLVSVVWMGALVSTTLVDDPGARRPVVVGTFALAAAWSALTVTPPVRRRWLTTPTWVVADGLVTVWISISPFVAGSRDLFFGGYPLSWLLLVAYAGGLWPAITASVVLAAGQVIGSIGREGHTITNTAGDIAVFMVSALVFGWGIDVLRRNDRLRTDALRALEEERRELMLANDRAEIAAHLHDSVLQTLALVQQSAADPRRVTALARGQERELRQWIDQIASPHERSFRAALRQAAGEVEDTFLVKVETVVVGDCSTDERLEAVLHAAREALVNAAKHSGAESVSLYAEVEHDRVTVTVRDRGKGFDPASIFPENRGLADSIVGRMSRNGGTAEVDSSPGGGTEIVLRMGRAHD